MQYLSHGLIARPINSTLRQVYPDPGISGFVAIVLTLPKAIFVRVPAYIGIGGVTVVSYN